MSNRNSGGKANERRLPTPTPKPKRSSKAKPLPVPVQIRRASEFWFDIFMSAFEMRTMEGLTAATAVIEASLVADAALDEFERRWPGIGYPKS